MFTGIAAAALAACLATAGMTGESLPPAPAVLSISIGMRGTTADMRLRDTDHVPSGMVFVPPFILRHYHAADAVFERVTLRTCAAGGAVTGMELSGSHGQEALALARKKFSLRPGERTDEHPLPGAGAEWQYAKSFAQDVRLSLRVHGGRAELVLHSPAAEAQCRRKLEEARRQMADVLADREQQRAAQRGAAF